VIHDAVQLLRRQHEGVSTGQPQVVHFGMTPDVCGDFRVLRRSFIGYPADDSLKKTVPTVRSALIGHQKTSLGILVLQAGNDCIVMFPTCIQTSGARELLKGGFDYVLELLI
jgi:hypothetical protein